MRLRYATILLSSAASFMLVSLALNFMSPAADGTASAQPPTAADWHSEQPAFGQLRNAEGTERNAQRPTPAKAGPAASAAGGSGEASALPEFETGTDYRRVSPRARVTFNLEEADLPDLVRLISNLTGKRFILPGKVRSIKATVFAPTKVSVSEAYNAFLSILDVNGLTVVPRGRYWAIEETSNIENQPISINTGNSPTARNDRFQTRLHRVSNVSAEDVATLLGRFKSAAGSITAYAPTNTLIITDTGTQIRRMLHLIEAIDVPRTGEQIWIEPIHHATAEDIATRLNEIFPSSSGASSSSRRSSSSAMSSARRARPSKRGATPAAASSGPSTVGSRSGESRITNIIADERTNSLIILATERAYLRILEMIRRLDTPLEGEGRIHVHYVQNGDASEIAGTLQSLIGGGGSAPTKARSSKQGASARRTGGSAGAGLPDLFEGNIRVTTHEPTNALVITSSLHDYAALRRVIERLDRPRRQVFIEAVVMELSVTRSEQLGLSFHGGVPNVTGDGDGSLSLFGFNPVSSLGFPAGALADQSTLSGLAVGVRGPNVDANIPGLGTGVSLPGFGVVLNALATSGDVNVLSTPHIIAMNNVQAEINVGQNVPLQQSGIAPGSLGGLGGLAGLAGLQGGQSGGAAGLAGLAGLGGGGGGFGVPRQDVGTIIRVTPHINELDEIRLEIEEEISEVGAAQGDLGVVPINRRTAKTEVQVRDQQTVVIGGLMRESVNNQETKVPVLGDIPLLGALFRRTQRQTSKNNLLLFLTPYIIRDMGDLRAIYERKMRERQEFLDRYFVFGDHDYEPPVDYSRTRGLGAEIINELENLDEEERLQRALEDSPPPEHTPSTPVGSYEGPGLPDDATIIEPEGDEPELQSPPPSQVELSQTPPSQAPTELQ